MGNSTQKSSQIAKAVEPLVKRQKDYNPDEARDESGKWTSSGANEAISRAIDETPDRGTKLKK